MKEKEIYTNNVVAVENVPPEMPIVVCEDGEIKGVVCKVHSDNSKEDGYRTQWVNGYASEIMPFPKLVSNFQAHGFTLKTQLEQGEPLQEVVAGDSWVDVEDIKDSDLVLVKKNGEIVGTVQYYDDSYFIATSMSEFKAYRKTLRCCIEEGHSKGYSFWLQV